jgi:hypothetical protein
MKIERELLDANKDFPGWQPIGAPLMFLEKLLHEIDDALGARWKN